MMTWLLNLNGNQFSMPIPPLCLDLRFVTRGFFKIC